MTSNKEVIKSGVWYTISNFLIRSIAFVTTPIFSRILTQEEYGAFSNFASWISILAICVTFDLESTLIVARFEYKENMKSYIFSMFLLSSIGVGTFWLIFNIFPSIAINIFDMNLSYINMMMLYLVFLPIINIFMAWERFQYKYKITILVSAIIAVMSTFLGIVLVYITKNGLFGRTLGFILPTIGIGGFIYLEYFLKVKIPNIKMWKYALPICLPFIPHLLSLNILNSLDRVMITKFCGARENALYSVAYSVGAMVTILVSALNNAYSPWLSDNLYKKNYEIIKKYSFYYVGIFFWIAIGIMLLSPEVLLLMGGKRYIEAMNCMPPVAMGCVCQFVYCMYVNVEQYNKKTIGMAIVSVSAAVVNFILNYMFIPYFGYIAAAYTTLVSYLWLMLSHMYLVKRLKLSYIYRNFEILVMVISILVISVFINYLYNYLFIRYVVIMIYIIITSYFGWIMIKKYNLVSFLQKNK